MSIFSKSNNSTVIINGVTIEGDFSGRSISVVNNEVIIDGKTIDLPDQKVINVEIRGDVEEVIGSTGQIRITGNVGKVRTSTGDVEVGGFVTGDINTSTGDVRCGDVSGSVRTSTGDIYKK